MVEVTVIGVEPPCVRCSLVVQRVYEQAGQAGIEVRVQKLDCRSPEAQALARQGDREVGTAKDVARQGAVPVDWGQVGELLQREWSPDLDQALQPCQDQADQLKMWMTPVLIIAGRLKHHGSVPSAEQIRFWLLEARTAK
jgi:hypothetical protein